MVSRRRWTIHGGFIVGLLTVAAASFPAPIVSDKEFLAQMHAAMMRMDAEMAAPPAGSADADFVAMMVPHHQAAIDMAQLQLRFGHNERLARIAQEIIVEQQQEITVMQSALEVTK
jgi:uncharacterized protein (DUF305 family)